MKNTVCQNGNGPCAQNTQHIILGSTSNTIGKVDAIETEDNLHFDLLLLLQFKTGFETW